MSQKAYYFNNNRSKHSEAFDKFELIKNDKNKNPRKTFSYATTVEANNHLNYTVKSCTLIIIVLRYDGILDLILRYNRTKTKSTYIRGGQPLSHRPPRYHYFYRE